MAIKTSTWCLLQVRFDPDVTGPRHFLDAVADAGFKAVVVDFRRTQFVDQNRAEATKWRRQFLLAFALTLPVFLVAMVFPMAGVLPWLYTTQIAGFPLDELIKWGFTTPVQFGVGWRFHKGAITALRNGRWAWYSTCIQASH